MTTEIDETIVIKSTFNKTPGLKYKIEPCKNPVTKRYPDCVRMVDSKGDMILSEDDKNKQSKQSAIFLPENEPIEVYHGKTFNLNDPYQKAQWEAIEYSPLIAKDRNEVDINGNFIIDGAKSIIDNYGNPRGTFGLAELYIERPGKLAKIKNNTRKKILAASKLIENDSLDHMLLICRLFEKDMSSANSNDVEDFLFTKAEKDPDTIIKYYQAEESKIRLLLIVAQEKNIIVRKVDGLYYGDMKLGTNLDYISDMLKDNKELYENIKKETFPEFEAKKNSKK